MNLISKEGNLVLKMFRREHDLISPTPTHPTHRRACKYIMTYIIQYVLGVFWLDAC